MTSLDIPLVIIHVLMTSLGRLLVSRVGCFFRKTPAFPPFMSDVPMEA